MKSNSMRRVVLLLVLWISLFATGFIGQWISVALGDFASTHGTGVEHCLVSGDAASGEPVESGGCGSNPETFRLEASRDLNLQESLYNQYKTSPSAAGLQKIEDAIATLNTNLPALLHAARIGGPTLPA